MCLRLFWCRFLCLCCLKFVFDLCDGLVCFLPFLSLSAGQNEDCSFCRHGRANEHLSQGVVNEISRQDRQSSCTQCETGKTGTRTDSPRPRPPLSISCTRLTLCICGQDTSNRRVLKEDVVDLEKYFSKFSLTLLGRLSLYLLVTPTSVGCRALECVCCCSLSLSTKL
jgi:hypothetical protein